MPRIQALVFTCSMLLLPASTAFAQNPIPNPSFEDWIDDHPVDWATTDMIFPGSAVKSSSAYSGSWAVQLNVVEFLPGLLVPPNLQSGVMPGFPVSQQYDTLKGFYDFTSDQSDLLFISVSMFKGSFTIGFGIFQDSIGTSGYTEFAIPLTYPLDSIPDSAHITVTIGPTTGDFPHAGSSALLDDFELVTGGGGDPCSISMTGDVNESGNLNTTDIIYMVNTILKAGPAALPCAASADVNCTGTINTTDIIYLVNSVLKAGPAPCDACSLVPGTWSCP